MATYIGYSTIDTVTGSKTLEDVDAKKLMISSFIYLPILQLIYVIDKLL